MGQPEEINRVRLEAFVMRARRIEAHSLAQDREKLLALAKGEQKIALRPDGSMSMRRELPHEEVMESAAARVRPLILEKDDCYFLHALNALGYFIRDEPGITELIKTRKRQWDERVQESGKEIQTGYKLMVENAATGQHAELDHRKLALAWIYGDVVHHDRERRAASELFGIHERFAAAVPLVAYLMLVSIDLLDLIRALHERGRIELDDAVFTAPVVLSTTVIKYEGRMHSDPDGDAPAPKTATDDLAAEWTEGMPTDPTE